MVDSEWSDGVFGRRAEQAGIKLINKSFKRDDAELLRIKLLCHQLHTFHTQSVLLDSLLQG